jgi:hypothetical protein
MISGVRKICLHCKDPRMVDVYLPTLSLAYSLLHTFFGNIVGVFFLFFKCDLCMSGRILLALLLRFPELRRYPRKHLHPNSLRFFFSVPEPCHFGTDPDPDPRVRTSD